jgi:hypothetical protein
MNSEIQKRLLRSVFALFVPMTRLMLRYGITFDQFSDVAKEAFVRVAFSDTDGRGRPTNASRVSVKTGISRKEVSRIRDLIGSGATTLDQKDVNRSGPPAKVLHAWHTDPRFSDSKGVPRVLEFEGSEESFAALVRAVAGDVPPGAVRAELRKAGAILDTEAGSLVAKKRFFAPGNADEKAITALSGILFPLMSGIDHNSEPGRSNDGYIQRFAFSDGLSPNLIPVFRDWSRSEATKFIESIDDWLAEHESKSVDDGQTDGRNIVGIGVYYYEGPTAEDLIPR